MAIWTGIAFLALTAIAVVAILRPLMRRPAPAASRAAHGLAVYRDQLSELARDRERGLISDEEARGAEAEIGRRILALARDDADTLPTAPKRSWFGPTVLAAIVVFAALGIYFLVGAPGAPDRPLAARQTELERAQGEQSRVLEARATELSAQLAAKPDDQTGWMRLALMQQALGRNQDAIDSYRRAYTLSAGAPEVASSLGESLVLAAQGQVTPEAKTLFEGALEREKREPRARFYLGLAESQAGRLQEALKIWASLAADSRPDAPWMPVLIARIQQTAAELGIDPATVLPQQAPGPSAEDVQAAQDMTPEQRAAMVRGMVDQLAAKLKDNPNDLEGWLRLARSYRVLGEPEKSADAFKHAAALAPNDVNMQLGYAQSLLVLQKPGAKLPEDFIVVMRRVDSLEPGNAVAAFFLGMAAWQAGDKPKAETYWKSLLAKLPAGTPERAEVERRIEEIKAAR
ncbi:MAG: c-type cytochrome biogenesis protein CcmI [Alphaproteobacteria bacterium]|nr:c-type cytochrome biogenesis protein CcmI [Alphaproteobacteria bacterium]